MLLIGVILIVGALTYFPVLALGPVVEQFLMNCRVGGRSRDRRRSSRPWSSEAPTEPTPEPPTPRAAGASADRASGGGGQLVPPSSTRGSMARNPVMFVVEVGGAITDDGHPIVGLWRGSSPTWLFTCMVTLWLWFTVLFANFAEAMAERRGKAQADSLRKTRRR